MKSKPFFDIFTKTKPTIEKEIEILEIKAAMFDEKMVSTQNEWVNSC